MKGEMPVNTNIVISVIIVSIVALGIIGLGFGAYWTFFAQESLFELEPEEVISITLKKDGIDEAIVFDSKEDIEWFALKLNSIKRRGKDIEHWFFRIDDTSYSIEIVGEDGGTYYLGKNIIRCGRDMYRLTDESKKVMREIFAKFPKELQYPSPDQTDTIIPDAPKEDTEKQKAEKYAALPLPEKVTFIHTKIGYSKEEDITVIEITDKEKVLALYEGLKFDSLTLSDCACRCMPEYYLDFHNGYAMLFHSHGDAYYIGDRVEKKETSGGVTYYLVKDDRANYAPAEDTHKLVMSYFGK